MKLFYLFLLCVLITSCKSNYYSGSSATPNLTMNYNVDVDLEVNYFKTLQGISTTTVYFGIFKTQDKKFSDSFFSNNHIGLQEKMAATYKALENTGYDIIINPKYEIEITRGLFIKTITANVIGYGAKIKLKREEEEKED